MVTAPVQPRSTRDRPAKPPLSEDAVVDAALAICRAEGLQAVTMRRVAAELDTGPASLYVYVRGRGELLSAMLAKASSEVWSEPVGHLPWREQVHARLAGWVAAMHIHPGLASVAFADPPTSERMLLGAEDLMTLLLDGGISPQSAAWACDTLWLIATATAMETDEHRARRRDERRLVESMRDAFGALPPEHFPNLRRYSEEMVAGNAADRFRFAIDTFLDGLAAGAGPADTSLS